MRSSRQGSTISLNFGRLWLRLFLHLSKCFRNQVSFTSSVWNFSILVFICISLPPAVCSTIESIKASMHSGTNVLDLSSFGSDHTTVRLWKISSEHDDSYCRICNTKWSRSLHTVCGPGSFELNVRRLLCLTTTVYVFCCELQELIFLLKVRRPHCCRFH